MQSISTLSSSLSNNKLVTNNVIPTNSTEDISAKPISWKTLPPVSPLKWYEETRTRDVARSIFLAIGLLSAGATLFSANILVASPIVILTATATFALLSLTFILSGVYLSTMKVNELDDDFRKMKRNEVKWLIENALNPVRYSYLRAREQEKILTEDEVQEVLRQDITYLTFEEFNERHGDIERCMINSTNTALLKDKFLVHIIETSNNGLKSILNSPRAKFFGLTKEDIAPAFVRKEIHNICQDDKTYAEFISRNGYEMIAYIPDQVACDFLTMKFRDWVLTTMVGKGDIQAKNEFAKDFQAFKCMMFRDDSNTYGEELQHEILAEVNQAAILAETKGDFNYQKLRANISEEKLKHFIDTDVFIYNEMREAFLRMPYADMLKFKNDQKFLHISQDNIKSILESKWLRLSIPCVLKIDRENFFLSLQEKVFLPQEWTQRVINFIERSENSLRQILQLDHRFITSTILSAETIFSKGMPLSEVLENEIKEYNSFEKMLIDYTEIIFEYELLVKNSPSIAQLALEFVKRQAKNYLNSSHTDAMIKIVNIIENYSLLSPENKNLLLEAKKQIENLNSEHIQKIFEIQATFHIKFKNEHTSIVNRIDMAKKNLNLGQLIKLAEDSQEFKNAMCTKLKNNQTKIKITEQELEKLKIEIKLGAEDLNILQSSLNKMNSEQIINIPNLERNIEIKRNQIINLKTQLKTRLETDENLNQDNQFIAKIKIEIKSKLTKLNLQRSYEEVCRKFDNLSEKLINSVSVKLELERKIQACKTNSSQTQGLLSSINALVSSPLKNHEKELESIKSNEIELENLRLQVENGKGNDTSSQDILKDIENLKTQLSSAEKIIKQKSKAIENEFNVQQHENELLSIENSIQNVRNTERKKQEFASKISSAKLTLTAKHKQLLGDEKLYNTALDNLSDVEKDSEESVVHWELAEKNYQEASRKYLAIKADLEKELIELKLHLEKKLTEDLENEEILHCNCLEQAEKEFEANLK